jgi:hypothetical protein
MVGPTELMNGSSAGMKEPNMGFTDRALAIESYCGLFELGLLRWIGEIGGTLISSISAVNVFCRKREKL